MQKIRLYINSRSELRLVNLDEVAYLKADGNYTDFHFVDGHVRSELSCLSIFEKNIRQAFEKESMENCFIRVGRSYLVNVDQVASLNFQSQSLTFKSRAVDRLQITKTPLSDLRQCIIDMKGSNSLTD